MLRARARKKQNGEVSKQRFGCNALRYSSHPQQRAMPRGVIELKNDGQFDEAVQTDAVNVVLFSAPWCGACTDLKKPFRKLSKELTKEPTHSAFRFYGSNVDKMVDSADKWKADRLPTVMLFRNGKPIGQPLVGPSAEAIRLACEQALKTAL